MKKMNINKKLILCLLFIFLLLIVIFSYIKISGYSNENTLSKKEMLPESSSKKSENKLDLNLDKKEQENSSYKSENTEQKIIKIAHIDEIKSPFKGGGIEKNTEESQKVKTKKTENSKKPNYSSRIMYLENNLIEKDIFDNQNIKIKDTKVSKNKENKLAEGKAQVEAVKTKEEKPKIKMSNFRLPFKLLGIIKNKENSTALILYQGKTIGVKENEFLDGLLIEKINNNNLIISVNGNKRKVSLWEEEK